jgi:hypothetical protein
MNRELVPTLDNYTGSVHDRLKFDQVLLEL